MKKLIQKLKRWSTRQDLLAVPNDKLDEWLDELGLIDSIDRGEIVCLICRQQINKDNLQIVANQQGKLIVICSDPKCGWRYMIDIKKESSG